MTEQPSTMTPDDLKHHTWLMARLDTIPEIDQQIQQLTAKKAALLGSREVWVEYASETYGLADADMIARDGRLLRLAAPEPEAPPTVPVEDTGEDTETPAPQRLHYVSPYAENEAG